MEGSTMSGKADRSERNELREKEVKVYFNNPLFIILLLYLM
jgi:hypothetical protein